jgi:hypothetical protein
MIEGCRAGVVEPLLVQERLAVRALERSDVARLRANQGGRWTRVREITSPEKGNSGPLASDGVPPYLSEKPMPYDPARDLYELLAVVPDAAAGQIRERLEQLRGVKADVDLTEAAAVLLDVHARTAYDTHRATHRMRTLLRESLAVLAGRTPAAGVPIGWPRDDS